MIIAQYVAAGSIANMVILFIVVVAVLAIGAIVLRNSGIAIPSWAINIFWVVVLAIVAVAAVKFLMGWV